MSWIVRSLKFLVVAAMFGALAGCASVPDDFRDPRDPWESYNRGMHQFNSDFDKAIFTPVAKGYRTITPELVDRGITNFFNNLRDFTSALNNLLQLKLSRAVSDVGRIAVNTTIGLLGFIDVASNLDLPSHKEDFGQTLGYWGIGPGPYLVLPFVGPRTLVDAVGIIPDWYSQPVAYVKGQDAQWSLYALNFVDKRADLLSASKVLEEAALDPYAFTRNAYLQKRRYETYDGNPPLEEDFWPDETAAPLPDEEAPVPEP